MPNRIPALIAGLATFFLLIVLAVLSVFGQMIALNGVSESQGFNALSISVICQSVGLFPAILLARWLANRLIANSGWNPFLAVMVGIIAGTSLGGVTTFVALIGSTVAAGIR